MADTKKGDSIAIARAYLDSLCVEGRIIGAVHPSSKVTLFGTEAETPIMTAALSHLKGGMAGFARGAKDAGAIACIGMGSNEALGEILETGAKVVKIIKPYADPKEIYSRIEFAETHGALAVGMDVEHSVNVRDDADSVVMGEAMKLPTLDELRAYIRSTKLPFVIKGTLSVQDALRCADLGAAGIILSHHNSLMRWAVPPVALLPEIRAALEDRAFTLIADGGFADGFDAFKALALGADAVSVGKALMGPYDEKGAEGVADKIREITGEVKAMLVRTGSPDPAHIDPDVIWRM